MAALCLIGLLWGGLLIQYPASADRPKKEVGTAAQSHTIGDDTPWRRTKDGWEPAWWLVRPKPFYRPTFHPLSLFAAQMLCCAAVALTEDRYQRRLKPTPPVAPRPA
ncbi:hypothetical protein [Thermopirellula anaerolimosa]